MKQPVPLRIVVADNHILLRQLIIDLLSESPREFKVVDAVASLSEATRVCLRADPNLLLIKAALLLESDATFANLRRELPGLNVLSYAGPGASEGVVVQTVNQGASGYLGPQSSKEELLEAIRQSGLGSSYFSATSARILAKTLQENNWNGPNRGRPSRRETEVLRLIAFGQTSKEIAKSLGLSVATVDTHRRNLMAKIHARNAAEVIRYGHEHELLAATA